MIYRNPKLLALAPNVPHCMRCGRNNDGTVVAAHANMQSMGKGTGIKAADIPAYLCSTCHDIIDQRVQVGMKRKELESEWALAAVRSMRWALEHHPEVFR